MSRTRIVGLFTILPLVVALISGVGHTFGFGAHLSSGTPNIPSGGHGRRSRAKVPNDGRWHMKHHRSRG